MTITVPPGYRYGDHRFAGSPASLADRSVLRVTVRRSDDDRGALRRAGRLLNPQIQPDSEAL
jgi:hypothetical protein